MNSIKNESDKSKMINSQLNQKGSHNNPININLMGSMPHLSNVMMHPANKFAPMPPNYPIPAIGSSMVPPMGGGLMNPANFANR
jgi:hypothetical protein